jgi:hypothetical protein
MWMMFSSCHSPLAGVVQIALILNLLCGVWDREIARICLTSNAALEKTHFSRIKKPWRVTACSRRNTARLTRRSSARICVATRYACSSTMRPRPRRHVLSVPSCTSVRRARRDASMSWASSWFSRIRTACVGMLRSSPGVESPREAFQGRATSNSMAREGTVTENVAPPLLTSGPWVMSAAPTT